MKTLLSVLTFLCGLCLLAGCGGGNSTTPPPPAITVDLSPNSAQALDVNQSDSFTATVSNDSSNQGVNWTVTCPAGVNTCGAMLQSKTASGTPNKYIAPTNVTSSETVTLTASSIADSTRSKSVRVTVNPALSLVNPPPVQQQSVNAGRPFSLNLMNFVQGGTPPFTWSITSGALPAGLSLKASSGMITGTPSTPAAARVFVFTCTDSGNPPTLLPGDLEMSLTINAPGSLTITSGSPPNGIVGIPYGGTHFVSGHSFTGFPLNATGGQPSYTWSWTAAQGSSLPSGLNLSLLYISGGSTRCCVYVLAIAGTPTTAGTYKVMVTVTDSGSPAAIASANYTIVISNSSSAAASAMTEPSSRERHTRYKLIDVGTLGGPNSNTARPFFEGVVVPSLNQKGTFVGQAETSTPDSFSPNCFHPDCYVSHAIKWEDGVRTDLGVLPGPAGLSSATTWIGGNGLIVGFSENGEVDPFTGVQSLHGVLWKHGRIFDLGTLKAGYESVASAINDWGEAVGYANNAIPDAKSLAGMGSQTRAVAWWDGEIHDLGTLGGADAVALYVNDLGQIAGQSYTASSLPPPIPHCGDFPLSLHAFIWENSKMTDLETLGGTCAFTYALNNRGQIVGQANLKGDQESHPFLWEHGVMKDLGALGGTYGYASWLNDKGEVVGSASNRGDQALLSFLWMDGVMSNLGTLNGDSCSAADAINFHGQVVGGSGFYDAPYFPACTDTVEHAVLWENGEALDLNTLVTSHTDLTLSEATFINDRGEISGFGTLANGETHAFVLIPCDGKHAEVMGCDYSLVDSSDAPQVRLEQTWQATDAVASTTKLSPAEANGKQRVPLLNRRQKLAELPPK